MVVPKRRSARPRVKARPSGVGQSRARGAAGSTPARGGAPRAWISASLRRCREASRCPRQGTGRGAWERWGALCCPRTPCAAGHPRAPSARARGGGFSCFNCASSSSFLVGGWWVERGGEAPRSSALAAPSDPSIPTGRSRKADTPTGRRHSDGGDRGGRRTVAARFVAGGPRGGVRLVRRPHESAAGTQRRSGAVAFARPLESAG